MISQVISFQTRKPRLKHYVALKGETGRRIYFRPERFKGRTLFPDGLPQVTINEHPVTLSDLSMTGLAVTSRNPEPFSIGAEVKVRISHGLFVLYDQKARVVRMEPTILGVKIGINLFQRPIQVKEFLDQYASATLQQQLIQINDGEAALAKIPSDYKELCGDLLFMLRRYRSILDDFETTARAAGTWTEAGERKMLDSCLKAALPAWKRLWVRGNALIERIPQNNPVFKDLKEYTEQIITPEFMDGPVWNRSYHKPYGYPGDYMIMKALYDPAYEGKTAYGKFLHMLGVDMGVFVPNRMMLVRDRIARLIADAGQDQPVRITNLGCGLAREISTLPAAGYQKGQAHVTLIDQDERALDAAMQECTAKLAGTGIYPAFLNVSMTQIASGAEVFADLPQQQMIYSLGILDYISEKRARPLLQRLYDKVCPGGQLIIANMYRTPESTFWPLECVFDWNLIYRTEDDMRHLVEDLATESVETVIEPSGRAVILLVRKPQAPR